MSKATVLYMWTSASPDCVGCTPSDSIRHASIRDCEIPAAWQSQVRDGDNGRCLMLGDVFARCLHESVASELTDEHRDKISRSSYGHWEYVLREPIADWPSWVAMVLALDASVPRVVYTLEAHDTDSERVKRLNLYQSDAWFWRELSGSGKYTSRNQCDWPRWDSVWYRLNQAGVRVTREMTGAQMSEATQ